MQHSTVRTDRSSAPRRRGDRLVPVLLLALTLGACADDGGTTVPASPDNDAGPVEIVVRGDDGPRFDAVEPLGVEFDGLKLPLRSGRRYELYRTRAELEAAWGTLFVDAGLADAAALPPTELGDGRVAIGLYLGEQRGGDGGDAARRYDIALERYVDATGGTVVQVALELLRDCDAPPPATDPSPFLIVLIELPDEAVASRPVRFVDVIGERDAESCGGAPTDPAALLVRSLDDTEVTLGFAPELRAEATRGYTVGTPTLGGVVPNDDTLRVRVTGQLPGLNRHYGFTPLDETSPGRTVLVSTDAPSALFDRFVDLPSYVAWLRGIAGEGARDCSGSEVSDEGAQEIGNCLVVALGDGVPFVAAIEQQGLDSVAWEGLVHDRRGRFFVTGYDTIDFGPDGVPIAGQIFGQECALPTLFESNDRDFRAGCDFVVEQPRLDVVLGDGSPLDTGNAPSGDGPIGPLPTEPLVRGDLVELGNTAANERFVRPTQRVFADQAAFAAFHASLLACDCAVETPLVDFDAHRVVFVTRGIDTTVGADVTVGDVYESEGSVSVNVLTTNRADICPDSAPARGPFEFVAVPTVIEPFRFQFSEERRLDPVTCSGTG